VYHEGGTKPKKIQISPAESQVMEALWRKAPLTPEQTIAATAKADDWAPETVRT
jgi:predicted transcriptional regulator